MNKKGFTLIELIATILLIVLSSTVVVINLSGSTSKQSQTLEEKNNKRITEVACNAVDSISIQSIAGFTRDNCMKNALNGTGCSIYLKDLIKKGLVDAYTTYDDTGLDIQTRLDPNRTYVKINWVASGNYLTKKCEIKLVKIGS